MSDRLPYETQEALAKVLSRNSASRIKVMSAASPIGPAPTTRLLEIIMIDLDDCVEVTKRFGATAAVNRADAQGPEDRIQRMVLRLR